ncbi:MAG: AGE family epimerase/isomerase [Opitutales bacterium]
MVTVYRDGLCGDVLPFWLRHGWDRTHGGIFTGLDREGSLVDDSKSVWFQGTAAWMYATAFRLAESRFEWLELAQSCVAFLRRHGAGPDGSYYFILSAEGRPRIRRHMFCENYAALGYAAVAKVTGDRELAEEAWQAWELFLEQNFHPLDGSAKIVPVPRATKRATPKLAAIATAQELRDLLGERSVRGGTCTQWIDWAIGELARDFMKPELEALVELVARDGAMVDTFEGWQLDLGLTGKAAWFFLREAKFRGGDARLVDLGTTLLRWMWSRSWDADGGGLFSKMDVRGVSKQRFWHPTKCWWPHNMAIMTTLLAADLTGDGRYLDWHAQVHDWAHAHFPDPEHGEWFGYLDRAGRPTSMRKGSMFKGPFHLPRMQLVCWKQLADPCFLAEPAGRTPAEGLSTNARSA